MNYDVLPERWPLYRPGPPPMPPGDDPRAGHPIPSLYATGRWAVPSFRRARELLNLRTSATRTPEEQAAGLTERLIALRNRSAVPNHYKHILTTYLPEEDQ